MSRLVILRQDDKSERLLITALRNAGIAFEDCLVMTGRENWKTVPSNSTVLTLGAEATVYALGRVPETGIKKKSDTSFIHDWRGSIIPGFTQRTERLDDYLWRQEFNQTGVRAIIPTFDPALVNKAFDLHPWFLLDLQKASRVLRDGLPVLQHRTFYLEQPSELERLRGADLIAVDSEISPKLISLTTDEEVHCFDWDNLNSSQRLFLKELMESPRILKVAHNWSHDHAWFRSVCDIIIERPYFDTMGGASILNSGLPKDLSPSIATKFTNWPFHKWLVNHDPYIYCSMDGISTYDAYWPMWDELADRKLLEIAEFDHKLLTPLLDMTGFGFRIDESQRSSVELELRDELEIKQQELTRLVRPVIDSKLGKFQKPHLFRVKRKCPCCGGGTLQRSHCINCLNGPTFGVKITREIAQAHGFKTIKAMKEALPLCKQCEGTGKVDHDLPFNPDSSDQVADIIYRGLGIPPRRFKGTESVKASLLESIKNRHVIVENVIDYSEKRAELDTVERLTPGFDSRLHCILDPWGTGSGRVAGKEGLIEEGTNPMNIPKPARRLVIPDPGHIFLYPDMNAIEARAIAVLSKDQRLMEAFTTPIDWPGNERHGKIDSHTRVMQLMLEEAGLEINRDGSKRLSYATYYGGEAAQVAKEINAEMMRKKVPIRYTDKQMQEMQDAFLQIFSGVRRYQNSILEEVFNTRKLKCPLTGREFVWNDRIGDRKTRQVSREIKKQIWSRLPQWLGAYVLGKGLIDIYYNSGLYGTLLRPQIHVHDALLMQAPIGDVELAKEKAISYLSRREWGMDFPAEMKTGMNWLEAS